MAWHFYFPSEVFLLLQGFGLFVCWVLVLVGVFCLVGCFPLLLLFGGFLFGFFLIQKVNIGQHYTMFDIGGDIQRSSGPPFLLLKYIQLEQVAQVCVQMGLNYLQEQRCHNYSGQPVPVLIFLENPPTRSPPRVPSNQNITDILVLSLLH